MLCCEIISAIISFCGVLVAWFQLGGLKKQVKMAVESEKTDSLKLVLQLSIEVSKYKAAFDRASCKISSLDTTENYTEEQLEAKELYFNTSKENYFNALEMLCMAFDKGYVKDNDWKVEYREDLLNVVRQFSVDFQDGSPYHHIKNMNNKWQQE